MDSTDPNDWDFEILEGAAYPKSDPNTAWDLPTYPNIYVAYDGTIIHASGANELWEVFPNPAAPPHYYEQTRRLNLSLESWSLFPGTIPNDPNVRYFPMASVLFANNKVMRAGGSIATPDDPNDPDPDWTYTVSARAQIRSLNFDTDDLWTELPEMPQARLHLGLVGLPDGKVLAMGNYAANDPGPDLYDPYENEWTTMASGGVPRWYHGSYVLLKDGSVLAAGGDTTISPNHTFQIYKPPYFFQGDRPTITSAPSVIEYASAFEIETPDWDDVTAVRLIRTGSSTHSFDFNQRVLELQFAQRPSEQNIRAAAPANGFLAPPGYYLLFIATGTNGSLPSEGKFVQLLP
jgi:hypothetical protein